MRDRIISNVLIKMGNRIKKKELDYLENVLVEEFRDVQIKKESTELTEYNDSLRKLKDPTRKVKKIKVTKKKKKAFTSDELERMRIACTDIRDRALIEMLACTGCRVSELSNINLNDIDFTRKKVRIIGKGDKERTVFISDQAMIYLNRYLETRQDNNISLFVSKRYPYDRLRKDGIERIVRDLGRSCNVYAHPHKFRRTLCTQLIKRGMPLQDVAILLGHADINMTASTYYDASDDMIEYEYIRYAA